MSDERYGSEKAFGTSDDPVSGPARTGDRPMGFERCRAGMWDAASACPCGFMLRAHPVLTFVVFAVAGLCLLGILTGVILGILGCLRTF